MGGHAFRQKYGVESKRLNNSDYLRFSNKLNEILPIHYKNVHEVRAYREKLDFGDIDFNVSEPVCKFEAEQTLARNLFATHAIKNSAVTSYLIDGFQVDINLCEDKFFDSSNFYMDYDPAGNLMGKLAHKFGLSYGYDGLTYILRDCEDTDKLGKIYVSSDPQKICQFLGLHYGERMLGFDSQKDIFNWIIASKYFDHRIFAYENMNHIARTRDRKRDSYKKFMDYIQNYKNVEYDWSLKVDYLDYIHEYFPECNLVGQIQELKDKENKRIELAAKFNGNIAIELSGKTGKELGDLLNKYKTSKESFDEFLEENSVEDIKQDFIYFINEK